MEKVTLYFENLWHIVLELAPWLMFGMFIAGMLHAFLPEGFIARHLGRRRWGDVFKAVALGVPLPLCSCGVIPAAIGLKKDGASNGAAVGFLISTPQTGVDSLLVSATFLGWPFAVFKVLSALVSGMIGGLLVNLFDKTPQQQPAAQKPHCCHCENTPNENSTQQKPNRLVEMFRFGFIELLRDIYRWLIVGVIIAAAISTALPAGRLESVWWAQGLPGMFIMLAISIPMYICATASVPLAASLVAAGMSPGSALVLLMAGPTTNVATLGAIYRVFGRKILAIYLVTVAGCSIVFALLFDWVIAVPAVHVAHTHPLPVAVNLAAAVILLALMLFFIVTDAQSLFRKK